MLKLKFNSIFFFISFSISIFIVYVITPYPDIITIFPTPDNSDVIYNNTNGTCYKYNTIEVECDENTKNTPILQNKKSSLIYGKKRIV